VEIAMPSMIDMLEKELEDNQTVGLPGTSLVDTHDTSDFPERLKQWVRKVVNDFTKYNTDLNRNIAIIAQQNNLNNDQISRIVEEVNTQVYLILYNKHRGSPERDVDFDIASLQKIKDLVGNDVKANKEVVRDSKTEGEKSTMPKQASIFSEGGDSLNFLNYSPYDTGSLAPAKQRSERENIQAQVKEKLDKMASEVDKDIKVLTDSVDSMATAFVKYASLNQDVQSIFSSMCKDGSITKTTQLLIKDAISSTIETLKDTRQLPSKFAMDIELVDGLEKEASFSLGEYSLIKNATSSNRSLPTVVTNRKIIHDCKDLVSLAKNIQEQQESLTKKLEKKNKVQKMLQAPAK
jgi:hypothetical protein